MEKKNSIKINREHKDRLFRLLFGDARYKENLLSLYNALNDSDYQNVDDLEITTITDVIYIGVKNDVSFIIDCYMSLYEQQSDFNPNMPLRGIIYFSDLYSKYIEEKRYNIYGHRLVKIPTPKYVVFYIGDEKHYDIEKLRLSDAFVHPDTSGEFEWTATMIALNPGQNEALLEKCRPLREYTVFVNTIKSKIKSMPLEEAVEETIKECIAQGILAEFLIAHRAEVLMSCITEFNKELYEMDLKEEARELGLAEGRAEGLTEGRLKNLTENTSRLMKSLNLSLDEVCKLLEIEGEDYDYVKSNIM